VVAVAAPGVGEGGVAVEVVGEAVAGAVFGAGDGGVDVIGVGAVAHHAALVGEQDVVVDLADVGGGPGFQVAVAVLAADVELGGFFRFDGVEGVDRSGRAFTWGEQFPIVREALHVADAHVVVGVLVQ